MEIFLNSDISQGSVATFVRCGSIYKDDFIAYLLKSLVNENYGNRLAFGKVTDKSVGIRFFGLPCTFKLKFINIHVLFSRNALYAGCANKTQFHGKLLYFSSDSTDFIQTFRLRDT